VAKKDFVDELLTPEVIDKLRPKTTEEALERDVRRMLMGLTNEAFVVVGNAVAWEAERRLRKSKRRQRNE
jgi:hypothetical protein